MSRLVSRKLLAFTIGVILMVALVVLRADVEVQRLVAQGLMFAWPVLIGGQALVDAREKQGGGK